MYSGGLGMEKLTKGIKYVKKFKPGPQHSAKHVGSGNVEVLSTPSMIAFMEETCKEVIEPYLPSNKTTVGTLVNIKHMAAAPIGEEIEVRAELLSIDRNRLTFWVEAWWGGRKIGQGIHERAIIDKEEFLSRLKELVKR